MVTRHIFLPEMAQFPSASFPQLMTIHSTERRFVLAFDATNPETCMWNAVVPQGFTATASAVVKYAMASATTGEIDFEVLIEAVSAIDALDLDSASSYATANTITAPTVPGTAGYHAEFTCALTNDDGLAVGDLITYALKRDAGDGTNDTAAGDCYVLSVEIRDAA